MNVTTTQSKSIVFTDDEYSVEELSSRGKTGVKQNVADASTLPNFYRRDSHESIPEIEKYNNYTNTGKNNSKCDSSVDEDISLPWWLVNMLKNSMHNSEWVMQTLEEAGIDKCQLPDIREMKRKEREMFRQMLKEQAEAARLFAEGLAEEAKMRRKMMEAFREIIQGKNPSPEGQQLLAQFAPMLLFIALLMKNDEEESEENTMPNSEEKSDDTATEEEI